MMPWGGGVGGSSESQVLTGVCLLLAEGQTNQGRWPNYLKGTRGLGFGYPGLLKAIRHSGALQAITVMKHFKAFLESQSHT